MEGFAMVSLGFGFTFDDLYDRAGLGRLDARFLAFVQDVDSSLAARLTAARQDPGALEPKAESQLLIDLAPHAEDFISALFAIRADVTRLAAEHNELAPLYAVKRLFVQRRATKGVTAEQAASIDGPALAKELAGLFGDAFSEFQFAKAVTGWMADEAAHKDALALAQSYAAWATLLPEGQKLHHDGVLFKVPHKVDPEHMIPLERNARGDLILPAERLRTREGFDLTDHGMDLTHALDQANYCIWCHNQGKDSCSTGLREKPDAEGKAAFKKSHFGITLAGCPLDEKISEMNLLKSGGHPIGALAMVTVDNPTCAFTGHRICNDCMKSCIYQKQEPVDIPQVETRTLKDVLALPYGFEIYSLLTRWNPLNLARPLPKAPSGRRVLVVGLGPAGATLSHHLLNEGHEVVAIDGLKIEPLPAEISGVDGLGRSVPFVPVRDIDMLRERLSDRAMAGFGGVAEYGITVRWDKNFLKVARLILERRRSFTMIGGVRFGGTLTLDQAFEMGFDHVALCMGAGKPTVLEMDNALARGVRTASDFLMALQLTGAAKTDTIANMQLRLPVVVIGGGLTAVDTATESLAYYPVQVEKLLARYDVLGDSVRAGMSEEENIILTEMLDHARAIRAERVMAAQQNRKPDILNLINEWGGVTIAYRKRLIDAPSYTLNHEEVALALQEGIAFGENLTPKRVVIDRFAHACGLVVTDGATGQERTMPAHTIIIAAGTQPNTVLAREDADHFVLDGKYFRAIDLDGKPVKPERVAKPAQIDVVIERRADHRAVTFFGDLHPSFAGNVVKAMGGAKQAYPVVSDLINQVAVNHRTDDFKSRVNQEFRAVVKAVNRLTPTIVEVVVHAPRAARAFEPGQFYRLQNFEASAKRFEGTILGMEGLALTGASVDHEQGLLSTIVLEMGGSSDLCAYLEPGEPVILMGPTGAPTEIEGGETVALVGGGLGNAVLFSIGQAFRAKGSKVLYFAGYKKLIDRYKVDEIERAADQVIWCSDEAPGFTPTRAGDLSFVGNIVEAMLAYGSGKLGAQSIPLADADRVICIGSDRMMAAVAHNLQQGPLKQAAPHVKVAVGSINSPMQCMMKEVCAQCLQTHIDPVTGERSYIFSCFNQDQDLDRVDWTCLNERLKQNSVQEKVTKHWLNRALTGLALRPAAE
jgi:NADPH-dependent glutamate synthase beta subunit-like oxidoreductase/NAD(P)H-flavin reductase